MQNIDDLCGDICQSRLINRITRWNIIIRRTHGGDERCSSWTPAVAREVTTREWVVAIVIQILDIVINNTVFSSTIRCFRRMVGCWINTFREGRLSADLDAVLAER